MRRVRSRPATGYGLLPVLIIAAAGVAACGQSTGGSAATGGRSTTGSPAPASQSAPASCQSSKSSPHAAVVVQPSKAKTITRCVEAHGAKLSAVSALHASGVQVKTKDAGGQLGLELCQVAHVPAHYGSCLSQGGRYWALFVSRDGKGWRAASKGLSHLRLHPGESLGLRYDSQQQKNPAAPAAPPPLP